jgi:hypothetical protein
VGVGNAELFFHEIEMDRALRRAMLIKLLLGIPSAVEESLTSQGRVALFFTPRLRLEYHDWTSSRRQMARDPSTSLRSAQDDKERIPRARSRDAQPMSLRRQCGIAARMPVAGYSDRACTRFVIPRDLTHGR